MSPPVSLAALLIAKRRRGVQGEQLELGDLFQDLDSASIESATVLLTPTGDDRIIMRDLQVLCIMFDAASIADARCRRPLWWTQFYGKVTTFLARDLVDAVCDKLVAAQVQAELRILAMMCDVLYLASLDPEAKLLISSSSDMKMLLGALTTPLDSSLAANEESVDEEVRVVKLRCKLILSAVLCRSVQRVDGLQTIQDVVGAERTRECLSYFCVLACAAPLAARQSAEREANATPKNKDLHSLLPPVLETLQRSLAPSAPVTFLLKLGDHGRMMKLVLADLAGAVEGAFASFRLEFIDSFDIETARATCSLLVALGPFWKDVSILTAVAERMHNLIAHQKWTSENKYACTAAYINAITCLLRTSSVEDVGALTARVSQGLRLSVLNATRCSTGDISVGDTSSSSSTGGPHAFGGSIVLQAFRLGDSILAKRAGLLSADRILLLRAIPSMLVALLRKQPNEDISLLINVEGDQGRNSATTSSSFLIDQGFRFVEAFAAVLPEDSCACDAVVELLVEVAMLQEPEQVQHLSEVILLSCSQRRGPLREDLAFGQSHATMLATVARLLTALPASAQRHPVQWLDALSSVDISAHGLESLVWSWLSLVRQFFAALDDMTLQSVLQERMLSSAHQLLQKLFLVLLSVHRAFDDDFILWSATESVDEALGSVLDLLSTMTTCGFHALIAQGIVQSDSLLADGDSSCIGALLWLLFDQRIEAKTARVVSTILIDVAENAPGSSYPVVRTATNASRGSATTGSDKSLTYRSQFGRRVYSSIADGSDAEIATCRLVALKALLVYETSLYFFLVTSGNASTISEVDEDAVPLSEAAMAQMQFNKLLLDTAVEAASDSRVRAECIELLRRSGGVPVTASAAAAKTAVAAATGSSQSLTTSTVETILQSVVDAMGLEDGCLPGQTDVTLSPINRSLMSAARQSTRLVTSQVLQTPRSARSDRNGGRSTQLKLPKFHWDEGLLAAAVCFVVAEEGHKLTPNIAPASNASVEPGSPRAFLSSPRVGASPKVSSFANHRNDITPFLTTPMTPQTPKLWKGVVRVSGAERVLTLSSLVLAQLAEEIEGLQQRIVPVVNHMQLSTRMHRVRLALGEDYLLSGASRDEGLLNELISLVESSTQAVRGIEAVLLSAAASPSDYFRALESALFTATLCHPVHPIINDILASLLVACLQCVIAAADALHRAVRDAEEERVGLVPLALVEAAVSLMSAYTTRPGVVIAGMQAVRLCLAAGVISTEDWSQLSPMNVSLVVGLLQTLAQQPAAVADDRLYTSMAILLDASLRWLQTSEHTTLLASLTDGLWGRFMAILRHHRVEMFQTHNACVSEAVSVLYVLDVTISQASCPAVDLLKLDEVLFVARRLGDASHTHANSREAHVPFAWHSLWCATLLLLRTFLSQTILFQPRQFEEIFRTVQGFMSTTPRVTLAIHTALDAQARDLRLVDLREISLITSLILLCFSRTHFSTSQVPVEFVLLFKELFLRLNNATFRKDDEKAHLTMSILRDSLEILCLHEVPQSSHVSVDCVYAVDPQCHAGGMGPPLPNSAAHFRATQRSHHKSQIDELEAGATAGGPQLTFDMLYTFIRSCISQGKRDMSNNTPKEPAALDSSTNNGAGSAAASRASSVARSQSGDSERSMSCNVYAPVIYPALSLTVKYAQFYSLTDGLSVADSEAMKNAIFAEIGKIVRALRNIDSDDDLVQVIRIAIDATCMCFGSTMDWV